LKPELGSNTVVIKGFNLPVNTIFDVSDNLFEIRYNKSMNPSYEFNGTKFGHGPYGLGQYFPTASTTTMSSNLVSHQMTTTMTDTYYIYSHDGKLMAEYDHNGNGVRDYIYMGSKLIAEYNVQTGKYYYYMSDQINSTRIVTDDAGTIVHSSAHGPYGEIQKTWVNTYDPKLKFSGKEREAYSGLDYFGARYYDHNRYRFISVDPIINKAEALVNPQLWNLYAYCRNNPITHYDPDGRQSQSDPAIAELEMWVNAFGVNVELNSSENIKSANKAQQESYRQSINGGTWLQKELFGDNRVWIGPNGEQIRIMSGITPNPGTFSELKGLIRMWSKGSMNKLSQSLLYHWRKHGKEMNLIQYLRKAANFSYKGAKSSGLRADGSIRYYRKSGEFIIKRGGKIVSYGPK
jgi:RHS repeat-associated protein